MNNKTVSSLFVLFAIVSIGMTAAPGAFAEHSMNATVELSLIHISEPTRPY